MQGAVRNGRLWLKRGGGSLTRPEIYFSIGYCSAACIVDVDSWLYPVSLCFLSLAHELAVTSRTFLILLAFFRAIRWNSFGVKAGTYHLGFSDGIHPG